MNLGTILIFRYRDKLILQPFFLLIMALNVMGCLDSAFYYPDRVIYDTPTRLGLRFRNVSFASSDGTRLSGWFIPAQGYDNPRDPKGTIIHFHGNAQNMSSHWLFVSWLPRRGFNVFVFDYRGYGESQGRPEPQGIFEDSNTALNYVRSLRDIDPERLIVFGQSLGGANAIAVVGSGNRAGVKAVAIEATFYSYSSIANDKFFGAGLFVNDAYSAEKYITRVAPIPLLLMHGTSDPVIPYAHSIKLFAKAREPKVLITVEGGGHTQALTTRFGTKYQDALANFFEASIAGK